MRGMMQGFQRAEHTLTSFIQASGQRFGNLEALFGKLETQMGQIAEALQNGFEADQEEAHVSGTNFTNIMW